MNDLEKRIADLEGKVQSQQEIMLEHMKEHEQSVKELREIFEEIKRIAYSEVAQTE